MESSKLSIDLDSKHPSGINQLSPGPFPKIFCISIIRPHNITIEPRSLPTPRDSRRARRANNRRPLLPTDRPNTELPGDCRSLQSAAVAVGVTELRLGWHGDGAAEGLSRSDGAGASRGLRASGESCGSGGGCWVGRTDLGFVLGKEIAGRREESGRHTIMQ